MNIVVVGGRSRADRLIAELLNGRNHIVAINNDRAYCRYLSARHDIDVVWGNGTQLRVLEGADVEDFDIIVALTSCDADNLAICQLAQRFLGIPRQLCTVIDPRNERIFRQLGITAAISGTAALARAIGETIAAINEHSILHPLGKSSADDHQASPSSESRQDARPSEQPKTALGPGTSSFHRIGRL